MNLEQKLIIRRIAKCERRIRAGYAAKGKESEEDRHKRLHKALEAK